MSENILKILVVEDSLAISKHYQNLLEAKGHRIFIAHNGKEELEIYEKEMKSCKYGKPPFDLIISDNSMPSMNGAEAGQKILDIMPNQKFFFVTSERSLIFKMFNVDGKKIDVEQKPLDTEKFFKKIKSLTKN